MDICISDLSKALQIKHQHCSNSFFKRLKVTTRCTTQQKHMRIEGFETGCLKGSWPRVSWLCTEYWAVPFCPASRFAPLSPRLRKNINALVIQHKSHIWNIVSVFFQHSTLKVCPFVALFTLNPHLSRTRHRIYFAAVGLQTADIIFYLVCIRSWRFELDDFYTLLQVCCPPTSASPTWFFLLSFVFLTLVPALCWDTDCLSEQPNRGQI